MKILKFKQFNEDAVATASSSGMGDVTSSQPGVSPGTFGIDGSGDRSFYFRKKRKRKGNPSEVSDAQDLAPVKINKIRE